MQRSKKTNTAAAKELYSTLGRKVDGIAALINILAEQKQTKAYYILTGKRLNTRKCTKVNTTSTSESPREHVQQECSSFEETRSDKSITENTPLLKIKFEVNAACPPTWLTLSRIKKQWLY